MTPRSTSRTAGLGHRVVDALRGAVHRVGLGQARVASGVSATAPRTTEPATTVILVGPEDQPCSDPVARPRTC